MKIQLIRFRFIDYLKLLLMTLDKKYSKERGDTFFSYLFKGVKSIYEKNLYQFAILVDGKFAGNIGLSESKKGEYELGYMVLREYRRKGVATKAINKIIKFGFEKLKISKVLAKTDVKNKVSQKVLIKNKFRLIKRDKKDKSLIWEKKK